MLDERTELLLGVVRELVAEVHAHDRMPRPVSLESSLDRDLGLDSLTRVELLVRVERRFSVHLPETVLAKVTTVGELLRELQRLRPERPVPAARAVAPLTAAEPAPLSTATLMEALRWHAERHPERVHVILTDGESEIERLTYGALARRATTMSGALAALGLRAGESVALMLPTGADFLASFYGVLLTGATPVPLYPPPSAGRIADHLVREGGILDNSRARLLVTVPEVQPFARMLRARVSTITDVVVPAELQDAGAPPAGRAPNDVALLHTPRAAPEIRRASC